MKQAHTPTLIYTQPIYRASQDEQIFRIELQVILGHWFLQLKLKGLLPRLNCWSSLEFMRNIRTKLSARRFYDNSLLGPIVVPSWKLTLNTVQLNCQKFKPSQMFKKEQNKMKMLFQVEAKPADSTTLFDSIKSHKKQPYLVPISRHLPTFTQGKSTLYSWAQEENWKTWYFYIGIHMHILRVCREAPLWDFGQISWLFWVFTSSSKMG